MFGEYSHLLSKPKPKGVGGGLSFREQDFEFVALLAKMLLIVTLAVAIGYAARVVHFGTDVQGEHFATMGLLAGLFFSFPRALDLGRRPGSRDGRSKLCEVFSLWNGAAACMACIWALSDVLGSVTWPWLLVFYGVGAVALVVAEAADGALRKVAKEARRLTSSRIMVVGRAGDIARFLARAEADANGIDVVLTVDISPLLERLKAGRWVRLDEDEQIVFAVEAARDHQVSDIVILTSGKDVPLGAEIAECFMAIPLAVHLNGFDLADTYSTLGVDRFGPVSTLRLRSEPLTTGQACAKRAFDIVTAASALLILSPLLVGTAILVRYTTGGPVLFRQRRRGLNQKEFRIFKFRTMTTSDDGAKIVQATQNDPRVTPIGRVLRKFNIDELPQLINVLLGDMSIVGPRPHAVAHDGYFERIVPKYRRRLNVRPGITGWAQVNGHRGETRTLAHMRDRVEHDLYYIEHWSLALDIYIVLMTVVSRKAYRNAF